MITTPKIAVLCNNRMAIPALQSLYSQGLLRAIGVPHDNTDAIDFCMALSSQTGIPLLMFRKETLSAQLDEIVQKSNADYIFTMTFPWKIPAEILTKYPGKFYNFHYGLLPQMRGADPVFESIRSGVAETGITVHAIENEIDKGNIILKQEIPLNQGMTHGILCTNLSWLSVNMLKDLLNLLQKNTKGIPQDTKNAKYYKRPDAADVCISWQKQDAKTIEALSRACNPWNKGAYTQWNGNNIRVVEAKVIDEAAEYSEPPGTILSIDENNGLRVQCNNNTQLRINIVYTDEGFMSGHKLLAFGVNKGNQFANL